MTVLHDVLSVNLNPSLVVSTRNLMDRNVGLFTRKQLSGNLVLSHSPPPVALERALALRQSSTRHEKVGAGRGERSPLDEDPATV